MAGVKFPFQRFGGPFQVSSTVDMMGQHPTAKTCHWLNFKWCHHHPAREGPGFDRCRPENHHNHTPGFYADPIFGVEHFDLQDSWFWYSKHWKHISKHNGSVLSSRHGSWLVVTPWWRLADSRILPPHQGELRRRWNSFVHRLFGAARITWPLGGSQAWRRWEWWGSYPPKKWPSLTTQKISTTCFSYDIFRVIIIWHLGIINDDYL